MSASPLLRARRDSPPRHATGGPTPMKLVRTRKKLFAIGALILPVALAALTTGTAMAQTAPAPAAAPAAPAAPAPAAGAPAAAPDLAARVADLEAYINNGAPKYLQTSGPGHNAWMMA